MNGSEFQPWSAAQSAPPARARVPDASSLLLRHVRLPCTLLDGAPPAPPDDDGLLLSDILLRDGRLAAIGVSLQADVPSVDLQGGQLWPCCVELHTHLDKGHIWPRARNADGTVAGAAASVGRDRAANWSAEDVERRFEFSLRCAFAHGTASIRTHIDSYGAQANTSWQVFRRLRASWSGRIELQGVSLTLLDAYAGEEGQRLADLVAQSGGVLGGVTRLSTPPRPGDCEPLATALDRLLALASERGLDVDLHVDETAELEPNTLKAVAKAVLRRNFKGRVVCGHCCSLALRTPADADETIELVREAGLCIVALPMVNLHLQSRDPHRTPQWRGVTKLRELRAEAVPVAVSSDNCRDPFYSFGDLDGLEVFREAARICHLDLDAGQWVQAVTRWPADIMRLPQRGRLAVGMDADLIAFRARSYSELLARPQADRIVLRRGRPCQAEPPDHRELDSLFRHPLCEDA